MSDNRRVKDCWRPLLRDKCDGLSENIKIELAQIKSNAGFVGVEFGIAQVPAGGSESNLCATPTNTRNTIGTQCEPRMDCSFF